MAMITRFEEIEARQTARQLANLIYELTGSGPFAKDFGLKDQIRRAAVSVMTYIAEGFESHAQALFIRHYWKYFFHAKTQGSTTINRGQARRGSVTPVSSPIEADSGPMRRSQTGFERSPRLSAELPRRKVAKIFLYFSLKNLAVFASWREIFLFPLNSIDFLGRVKGSSGEVRSQLYLALDRHYLAGVEPGGIL